MISPPLSLTDAEIEALPAEQVLGWAFEEFGERLCISCSWQKQSSVLVHMVSELGLDVDIVELDTHLFFKESYETRERLVERYGLNLIVPEIVTIAEQHKLEGPEPLGDEPRPLLPHPQGRAAHRRPRALRGLGLGHPPRAVALTRGGEEGRALRALRRLEGSAARGLDREGRVAVHPAKRDPVQPAARCRLPFDRLHSVHPADAAGRGGARRALGRLRQAGVWDSRGTEGHLGGTVERQHLRP